MYTISELCQICFSKNCKDHIKYTEGDWFHSNLNENDVMNRYNPSVAGIYQDPPTIQIDSYFERVQHRRFVCGACAEKVLEENLTSHHSIMHPEVPFIMDMYELFEIDEQCQCVCCNVEVNESNFKTHLELFHPQILGDDVNQNINPYSQSVPMSYGFPYNSIGQSTYGGAISKLYTCKACPSSGIHQSNLRRHHARQHPNIQATTNLFELASVSTKITCEICNKQLKMERIEKHRLKYHPDKYGERKDQTMEVKKPPEGFHNICISNSELERLKGLDRIYELNGRLHLKDST